MSAVREAALAALRAGISVVPPAENGTKAPLDGRRWRAFTERLPTESEVERWYSNGRSGVGWVGGAVSGDLGVLDFDEVGIFDRFRERAKLAGLGDLLERVEAGYLEETPNGIHLALRCPGIRTGKLAMRRTESGLQTLIECKAEGGYVIVAPSNGAVHPSGRPYVLRRGSVETIARVTPDQLGDLLELARTFDEVDATTEDRESARRENTSDGRRPGDDFTRRTTWAEVLEPHGWVRVFERSGITYWRRPGKDRGVSATTNAKGTDRLTVFSSSTPFQTWTGCGLAPTHDRFGAYAVLEHGGDLSAAARALAAQGYGERHGKDSGRAEATESWEPPLRLGEQEPEPWPTDALPSWTRDWVEAEAGAAQVPPDMPGVAALGVLAAALAPVVRLEVKPGYVEPANTYVVVGIPPANRKTQVLQDAAAPLYAVERERAEGARPAVARAEARLEVLRAQLAKAKKDAARSGGYEEVDRLAEELVQAEANLPAHPRLVADDVTPEALALLLARQGGALAVVSPEGGELFEMIRGRYSQNARANMGVFLSGHAGDPLRVDRVKRDPIVVERPALTLILTMQPSVLEGLADAPETRGRGLLARFLYSCPRSLLGERDPRAPSVPAAIRQDYHHHVRRLLDLPRRSEPAKLDPAALERWYAFSAELEPQLGEHGRLGHLGDWAGKLAGQTARLATILHAAEWADRGDPFDVPVEDLAMARAIRLARYFESHALRVFAAMGASEEITTARKVWDWIRTTGLAEVSKRDLWQRFKGSSWAKKAADLDAPLGVLVEHGYVRPKPAEDRKPGRRSEAYLVNPEALR